MDPDGLNELISFLTMSPSTSTLRRLTSALGEQEKRDINQLDLSSLESLINLEQWVWETLSRDSQSWLKEDSTGAYSTLFSTLGTLNRKIIFEFNDMNMKTKLLIPFDVDLIDGIFEQIMLYIDDEDEHFFAIMNLWLGNVAWFNYIHLPLASLPIIVYLNERLMSSFIMSDTFINYLKQMSNVSPSISKKQEFYLSICPFFLNAYLPSRPASFPYDEQQIIEYVGVDLRKIVIVHSQTISTWTEGFLGCITQLLGLASVCSWQRMIDEQFIDVFGESNENLIAFLNALIGIISYAPFHRQIDRYYANNETMLIEHILGIMICFIQIPFCHSYFRFQTKLIETLVIFDQVDNDRINLVTYRIQSDILPEEKIKQLNIASNIDEIFFRYLRLAWQHPLKIHNKIPIEELLKGFLNLSKNDIIKDSTAHSNQLSFLTELADTYPIIYDILWSLSFDSRIREQLNANEAFQRKLEQFEQDCPNEKMQKILSGLRWNLNHHGSPPKRHSLQHSNRFDLMISYSHKDKLICGQIYEELRRNGLKIWIDFNEIHGNMMDAMAQGIDQSRTILLCISEEYRRSNFCRAEAQYAFKRQAKIVPIIVQKSYKPDGWLLFLISGLLYIDFTKYDFPQAVEILLKELKGTGPKIRAESILEEDEEEPTQTETKTVVDTKMISATPRPSNIRQWNSTDVQSWLLEHHLHQMAQVLSDCNGSSLVYLSQMMVKEHTFSQDNVLLIQQEAMQKTGRALSVVELARFQSLMDDQVRVIPVQAKKWRSNFCCHLM